MAEEKADQERWVLDVDVLPDTTTRQKELVFDLRKTLGGADLSPDEEDALWKKHSIYRVPACIKDLNKKAYKPQVVSIGPFHHGELELLRMEEHKRRALRHMLKRVNKQLSDFVVAVDEVAQQLEDAYLDLGDEWRGENRNRFLKVMITDGCFLLEMMRLSVGDEVNNYGPNDPMFSRHGMLYTMPYIRRDMLMIENQLPLLVLERLYTVMTGSMNQVEYINRMVLSFVSQTRDTVESTLLWLHPLDVLHKSLLHKSVLRSATPKSGRAPKKPDTDIIRSAVELCEAGIWFKKSKTKSLHDIQFCCGVLSLPPVVVDDSTEYMFLNLMAFERLHTPAGNDVTSYVFFMDKIIDSEKDVSLLSSKGIIQNAVGSDKAVADLFNSLSKDVVLEQDSTLDVMHRRVKDYCRQPWNVWRANLVDTYFSSPWAAISLLAAVFLLVMTAMQTVYTGMPYWHNNSNSSPPPPSAPAPP